MNITIKIRQKEGSLQDWELLVNDVVIGEVQDGEGVGATPYLAVSSYAESASMHKRRGQAATQVIQDYLASLEG